MLQNTELTNIKAELKKLKEAHKRPPFDLIPGTTTVEIPRSRKAVFRTPYVFRVRVWIVLLLLLFAFARLAN